MKLRLCEDPAYQEPEVSIVYAQKDVRVSKSCILNINVLESVKPLFNSRMEAILTTGDRVYINRTYLKNVKQALKGYGA